MKNYFCLVVFPVFLLLINSAFAQSSVTETSITDDNTTITAGITPDNFLYGLDTAIDQLRMLLTFDNTAKAKLGLEIARERLLEVRQMISQNNVQAAARAQQEHLNILETIRNSAASISGTNATDEIKDEIQIEKKLEEHENEIDEINSELKIKIQIRGNITADQQKLIDSILSQMQNKTGEVKIKIDERKAEAKIKIRQLTSLNETEVEQEIKRIEVNEKLFEVRAQKALENIRDASEAISDVKAELAGLNASRFNLNAINVLLDQAESHLNNSQNAFNDTKFGEAFGQAIAAKNLAKNSKRLLEKLLEKENESEIRVQIERGIARVKVETEDKEFKFRLNSTDRETIVNEIVQRTGLARDRVESILEIKEEVKSKILERLETEVKRKEREIEKREVRAIEEHKEEREIMKERAGEGSQERKTETITSGESGTTASSSGESKSGTSKGED